MTLTNLQKAFITEYIKDLNGTQAIYRAGYQVSDDNTAAIIVHENLKKPKIKVAIDAYLDECTMSAKEVLYHLSMIGRGAVAGVDVSQRVLALEMLAKYHELITTTKVKTWKDEAIDAIRKGDINYEGFMKMFDDEPLARQLFVAAGVPIADDEMTS